MKKKQAEPPVRGLAQAKARRKPACDPETFVPVAKPEIGAHIIYIVGHGWAAGE
ncbi:hypothetical protein [Rhizobium mongolense]|uniref:hypothetical protein n=1 Tax=Rhizobium mongolense TaxID=57676 RepID=UPI001428CE8E|nr:hypothetical protein [Rhizobium mongolense]